MRKKLSPFRKLQKKMLDSLDKASDSLGKVKDRAVSELNEFDNQFQISESAKKYGNKVSENVGEWDQQLGASRRAKEVLDSSKEVYDEFKQSAQSRPEACVVKNAFATASDIIQQEVVAPSAEMIQKYGVDKALNGVGQTLAAAYGASRAKIKPYFPAESTRELLQNTRDELNSIASTLMQTSASETEQLASQFGTTIVAKTAGVAAAGVTFGAVSMFGTAGTGTAIASLSGAAANSATLAAIGSVVGGGMAAGAVITGGLSVVVGLAAYKILKSEIRPFESLSPEEQNIVQSCWMLIHNIDEALTMDHVQLSVAAARQDLEMAFMPLQGALKENVDTICAALDVKHAVTFRQEILVDFERVVIQGYQTYIAETTQHVELGDPTSYVIGGVFYALLTRTAVDDSLESQLVLEALRRSDPDLAGASEAELSDYLDQYNDVQLKGIANNVKGIYHELLYVEQYNATHDDSYAELFGDTSHPGSDVLIRDTKSHEVIAEYQLKATDSAAYVREHVEQYGDIPVMATNEVAGNVENVTSSGFENEAISKTVNDDIESLADNTLFDRVTESMGLAGGISGGQDFVAMLRGEKAFPDAVVDGFKRAGSAGLATALTAYLFS